MSSHARWGGVLVHPAVERSHDHVGDEVGLLCQHATEKRLPHFYLTADQMIATVRDMDTATIVVTGLLATLFLSAAGMKLAGVPQSLEIRDHLGVAPAQWRLIGVLELAGAVGAAVGLAVRGLGVAATGGLVLVSLGAIATHIRAGDPPEAAGPAGLALVLAAGALALQLATA